MLSVTALILLLALTISAFATTIPVASAKQQTQAFLSVSPKTIGVGQSRLVNAWISPAPPLTAQGVSIPYENYNFVITKPDGTTETKTIAEGFAEGTVWFAYTPTIVGQYSIKFSFPGDDLHDASESPSLSFAVQTEQVTTYNPIPLPDGYWERPLSAELREWSTISGGWPGAGYVFGGYNGSMASYNPYSKAPNTAHIVWKHQIGLAGLIGGDAGSKFMAVSGIGQCAPVIAMGRVYYTADGHLYCLDLRTGQEIWKVVGSSSFSTPVITPLDIANSGIWVYSSAQCTLYDLYTGAVKISYAGPGGGRLLAALSVDKADNKPYFYGILYDNGVNNTIIKWDATKTVSKFQDAVVWQLNIMTDPVDPQFHHATDGEVFMLVASTYFMGINMTPGKIMYNQTIPAGVTSEQTETRALGYGKMFVGCTDFRMRAFDIYTGELVWTSPVTEHPWGTFWTYNTGVAYGKVYQGTYDGHIYAFDAETGEIVWAFYAGDTTTTPYNTWPFYGNIAIADGKIYKGTTEHSPGQPYQMGFRFYCVDAENGNELWSVPASSWLAGQVIGEGTLLMYNDYDGYLYAFNKGKTETTVSVQNNAVTMGSSVLIEGTVMDLSTAQPNTPAISDDSMTAWMEYMQMNRAKPSDATGVNVHVTAIDPNGNFQDLGTAVSDDLGNYVLSWTPPVPGVYKVTATFEGSGSYYGSEAGTAFLVSKAVAAAPTSSANPQAPTETSSAASASPLQSVLPSPSEAPQPSTTAATPTLTYIAIGAAVVIVVVAAAVLIFRRRK
ncbi:MAG: PQQ-binding-like beta-propeller repeat protein [Candidatus Bathyarchaeota archaeon]|nr:PQQ-binding-like beta-propeller repeat protein [Candidatus Bathyarchaeota archaeon]